MKISEVGGIILIMTTARLRLWGSMGQEYLGGGHLLSEIVFANDK